MYTINTNHDFSFGFTLGSEFGLTCQVIGKRGGVGRDG